MGLIQGCARQKRRVLVIIRDLTSRRQALRRQGVATDQDQMP